MSEQRRIESRFMAPLIGAWAPSRAYLRTRRRAEMAAYIEALHVRRDYVLPGNWRIAVVEKIKPSKKPARIAFAFREQELSWASEIGSGLIPHGWRVARTAFLARVEEPAAGSFTGQILRVRPNLGTTLVFGFEEDAVCRFPESPFNENYSRVRALFSEVVPSAEFSLEMRGALLREQFVAGRLLRDVDIETRIRVVRQMLEHLATLPQLSDGEPKSEEIACRLALEPLLASSRGREAALAWLRDCPAAPSHGDLHATNIVFDGQQGVCLDFDSIGLRPRWADGLQLFFNLAATSSELSARFFGGAIDADLAKFLSSWGHPLPRDWKRLAFAAHVAAQGGKHLNRARGIESWFAIC